MVTPDSDPIASLHKLAMDLIDEARAVLQFRTGYGRDWDEIRRTRMPQHLRAIMVEAQQARSALSVARYELIRAMEDDVWYNALGERIAQAQSEEPATLDKVRQELIEEMKQAVVAAEKRVDAAEDAERKTEAARSDAEKALAREWHAEHHPRLAELLAGYEPEFTKYRHKLAGMIDLSEHQLGDLAEGASSACQTLLIFAQRSAEGHIDMFHGFDPDQLRVAVENEIGWLARSEPATKAPSTDTEPTPVLRFDAIEKAIVLLLRDGRNPRSMRRYADEVGISHSTLSRNPKWQAAWNAANAEQGVPAQGSKDPEGHVDAWRPELCENCRQALIDQTVVVKNERLRVCEECAKRLAEVNQDSHHSKD